MGKVLASNGEVLHCLLMVSTEKQRNENPDVSKKGKCCHCHVLWGRTFVFSFLSGSEDPGRDGLWYKTPAGRGVNRKKRLGVS